MKESLVYLFLLSGWVIGLPANAQNTYQKTLYRISEQMESVERDYQSQKGYSARHNDQIQVLQKELMDLGLASVQAAYEKLISYELADLIAMATDLAELRLTSLEMQKVYKQKHYATIHAEVTGLFKLTLSKIKAL